MTAIRWCPAGPPGPDRLEAFVRDAAGLSDAFWAEHEACSCSPMNLCRVRRPGPRKDRPSRAVRGRPPGVRAPPERSEVPDFLYRRERAADAAHIERSESRPTVG